MAGWEVIKKGFFWILSDANDILFWQSNWVYDENLLHLAAMQLSDEEPQCKVKDFKVNNLRNVDKLHSVLPPQVVPDNLPRSTLSTQKDKSVFGHFTVLETLRLKPFMLLSRPNNQTIL